MREPRPLRRPCRRCGRLTRSRDGRCTPCARRKGEGCYARADGQDERVARYAARAALGLPLFGPPLEEERCH